MFQRICHNCDVRFQPTGKYQRICDECLDIARQKVNRSGIRCEISKMVRTLAYRSTGKNKPSESKQTALKAIHIVFSTFFLLMFMMGVVSAQNNYTVNLYVGLGAGTPGDSPQIINTTNITNITNSSNYKKAKVTINIIIPFHNNNSTNLTVLDLEELEQEIQTEENSNLSESEESKPSIDIDFGAVFSFIFWALFAGAVVFGVYWFLSGNMNDYTSEYHDENSRFEK